MTLAFAIHAENWGVLSAVAWEGMRAMDYLETDPDVDHTYADSVDCATARVYC